jgi:hypothetical protein
LIPNQVKGAIGSNAYRYMDTTDWRDIVVRTQYTQAQLGLSFDNVTGADRNVSLIYLCILFNVFITYLLCHPASIENQERDVSNWYRNSIRSTIL